MSRPLIQKLGARSGDRIRLEGAPPRFREQLEPLPDESRVEREGDGPYDLIVLFSRDEGALRERFPEMAARLRPDGGLWVAWPKQASGVETDLKFDRVQAVGLEAGLVDNKICAVDETWSGLRFVVRREDRGAPAPKPGVEVAKA